MSDVPDYAAFIRGCEANDGFFTAMDDLKNLLGFYKHNITPGHRAAAEDYFGGIEESHDRLMLQLLARNRALTAARDDNNKYIMKLREESWDLRAQLEQLEASNKTLRETLRLREQKEVKPS